MEKINKDILFNFLDKYYSESKCALNYRNDYELLIAIVLSAQTTDKSVNEVTPVLFNKYKDIKSLANADIIEVENIIKRIGLYKSKSKNIINLSKKLNNDGYDYIPNDFDYLISLPGVGRKTTNVFLSEFYDMNTLGVDTHINRISNRLGITKSTNPLDVEKDLLKFIKDEKTIKVHHELIAFGRTICKAVNPLCMNCEISKYCKYNSKK